MLVVFIMLIQSLVIKREEIRAHKVVMTAGVVPELLGLQGP